MWLGTAVYLVPFLLVYNPAMLMIGPWYLMIESAITGLVGTMALATTVQGYMFSKMSVSERIFTGLSAILLLHGGVKTDGIGAVLLIIVIVIQVVRRFRLKEQQKQIITTG
jgi:TRAP-type uncharacterized transport system fused permease subunit